MEAAQLGLKLKTLGGIYIGGGIAPNIAPFMDRETFLTNFFHAGRMNSLLENIPIKIVLKYKNSTSGSRPLRCNGDGNKR